VNLKEIASPIKRKRNDLNGFAIEKTLSCLYIYERGVEATETIREVERRMNA
jgi:hypothetical protein